MSKVVSLVLALLGASVAFGAAPDSVAGLVYHEESSTTMRANIAFGRVLNPDGTYRGIYLASTYGTFILHSPTDGTWSYRKTGENTANLVFDGASEGRALVFSESERGSLTNIPGRFPIRTGRFSLAGASSRGPLVNCSSRSMVPVRGISTTGFVVNEVSNRVLVRAIGPGLSQFGVRDVLGAPILEVFSGQGLVARNSGWTSDSGQESLQRITEYVGAFPLAATSADSAIFLVLRPGAYTAQVSGGTDLAAGEVLVEVYVVP